MPVSFVARKCTQCAGKLEYIKEKKIWKCLYCGAEIEREEQYDGLFTIKNVVRQTLLDTAYRRLESASKNLIECEKIDSRYVGTLIAKLTYDMIRVVTPGDCDPREVKSVFAQMKKTYDQLRELGPNVTDDEEALYDFLEESDIFATLTLVYDSLNDTARRDFVSQMLDAKEVYSKPANNNLLSYALKSGRIELADQVIGNSDNLDPKAALAEVFAHYPDGEAKGDRVATLLDTGALQYEDRKLIEGYLRDTSDSVKTRSRVCVAALRHGLPIGGDLMMDRVVRVADSGTVKETLAAFCTGKIGDEDIMRILTFAYECGNIPAACSALDCLRVSDQYVLVPAKLVIAMLSNGKIRAADKLLLLQKSLEFKLDKKSLESVLTNYLCCNSDAVADRKAILGRLLDRVSNIPTSTVESYVLKCETDGDGKPEIVRAIFDKGLNLSFFHDLLSKYLNGRADSKNVRTAVIDILSKKGLKVDPKSLTEYICASTDETAVKIRFVKKMVANGSQLRADAASAYLERTATTQFSSELFSVIFVPGSFFSCKAVENYLLWIRDSGAVKADNARTIVERSRGDVLNVRFRILHLGHPIMCNLAQAYTLVTKDERTTALAVADYLISVKKMRINAEMNVSGSSVKMKKYVAANRASLSEATNAICERYKVYSMLF